MSAARPLLVPLLAAWSACAPADPPVADGVGRSDTWTRTTREAAATGSEYRLSDGTVVRLADADGQRSYEIITPDGRSSGRQRTEPFARLAHRTVDPTMPGALTPVGGPGAAHGELHVLQYHTPPLPAYAGTLASIGVEVLRFVPPASVVARVPTGLLERATALPFVRGHFPFRADDRLDGALRASLAQGSLPASATYRLQLANGDPATRSRVAGRVRRLGGTLAPEPAAGVSLLATLDAGVLLALAEDDDVLWIERRAPARTASAPTTVPPVDLVRLDGGIELLEQRDGLRGEGVRGEVLDEGLATGHPDFQHHPPIEHGPNSPRTRHGTGVTGVVFGDGATDPTARGLLPAGQAVFASFRRLGDRYLHTAELLAPPFEVVFQTNSWGNGPSPPGYPTLSYELDDILLRHDLLVCQAFGNAGRALAFRQAWAKNVVTVGGIVHQNTLSTADDAWDGRASAGPAADGRIKPDLCYWNDAIHTTNAPTGHRSIGGTSAATPSVAGHFGSVFEQWHLERFGNVAPGPDVFGSRPHAATARALLLHSAQAYDFQDPSDDLARSTQGWGRPDLVRLDAARGRMLIVDEDLPLANLGFVRYAVHVEEGSPSLRATLVYRDPPGNSAAAVHRINDLSLRVVAPGGVASYWGNHGLDAGNRSVEGGLPDHLDTVEQVWLENPLPGRWFVDVLATAVVEDAHLATPELDAAFALVVSPVRPFVRTLAPGRPAPSGTPAPVLTTRGSFTPGAAYRFVLEGLPPGARALLAVGDPDLRGSPRDQRLLGLWELRADDAGRAVLTGTVPLDDAGRPFRVRAWLPEARAGSALSNLLLVEPPVAPRGVGPLGAR